jgi:hypothetical protein
MKNFDYINYTWAEEDGKVLCRDLECEYVGKRENGFIIIAVSGVNKRVYSAEVRNLPRIQKYIDVLENEVKNGDTVLGYVRKKTTNGIHEKYMIFGKATINEHGIVIDYNGSGSGFMCTGPGAFKRSLFIKRPVTEEEWVIYQNACNSGVNFMATMEAENV